MSTPFHLGAVHHVSLTVSDVDRSIEWYRRTLKFTLYDRWQIGDLDKAYLVVPGRRSGVELVGHGRQARSETFSPRRTGLDHLAFSVPATDLPAWADRLTGLGVSHGGVQEGLLGDRIAFHDPDGIALELYAVA